MKRFVLAAMLVVTMLPLSSFAQERADRTLLSWDQLHAIINEVSGKRAQQAVLEMVPYPRVRPGSEYTGTFRESEVLARLARDSEFSRVEIETFPTPQKLWQASQAELWLVAPDRRKLCDFQDVAIGIASGSETGDVTADLVDVGDAGRPAADAGALAQAIRDARVTIRHQLEVEKKGLASSAVLFPTPADAQRRLAPLEPLLDQQAAALQADFDAQAKIGAVTLTGKAPEATAGAKKK